MGSNFADCDVVFGGFDLTSVNLTKSFHVCVSCSLGVVAFLGRRE